jgi:hypothetical protein
MMSANIPNKIQVKPGECTEFQLHKSQQTIFHGVLKKVYDFSEKRLISYIETIKDPQQKLILVALLQDYVSGHVAIAWKRGHPIWVKVTKA